MCYFQAQEEQGKPFYRSRVKQKQKKFQNIKKKILEKYYFF